MTKLLRKISMRSIEMLSYYTCLYLYGTPSIQLINAQHFQLLNTSLSKGAILLKGRDNGETPSNPRCTIAALQARFISGWSMVHQQAKWTTCTKSDTWWWQPIVLVWNILPVAFKACSELVKCSCKSQRGYGARCVYKRANWRCTELCSCYCKK